jgi:hypothetical protein
VCVLCVCVCVFVHSNLWLFTLALIVVPIFICALHTHVYLRFYNNSPSEVASTKLSIMDGLILKKLNLLKDQIRTRNHLFKGGWWYCPPSVSSDLVFAYSVCTLSTLIHSRLMICVFFSLSRRGRGHRRPSRSHSLDLYGLPPGLQGPVARGTRTPSFRFPSPRK